MKTYEMVINALEAHEKEYGTSIKGRHMATHMLVKYAEAHEMTVCAVYTTQSKERDYIRALLRKGDMVIRAWYDRFECRWSTFNGAAIHISHSRVAKRFGIVK